MLDSLPPARTRPPVAPEGLRADLWLAGALFVGAVLSAGLGSVAGLFGDGTADMRLALLYAAMLTLPLAARRRHPMIVALVVAGAFFFGGAMKVPELYVGNIALFIAMYTVGAWVDDRRRATLVRVVIIVGMFVWLLVVMFQEATSPSEGSFSQAGMFSPFVAFTLIQLLVNAAFFGGAFYMGDRAYAAALERGTLEERTRELESAREVAAAQAVALDRVAIARELHDVVAHHVSAMGVQAGAARAVMDRDPHAARDALLAVEASARSALSELRQLLETLRGPAADPDGSTVRIDDLEALVAHACENGLPTTLTVVGVPVALPEVAQVNLFRVAQEALTNARRHGGPDAAADVRLRYASGAVELEVVSTGRSVTAAPRAGLGMVGMRERAAASGGTIDIGPRARGGFRVRMTVPVHTGVAA